MYELLLSNRRKTIMEDEGTCKLCCAKLSQYFEVNE